MKNKLCVLLILLLSVLLAGCAGGVWDEPEQEDPAAVRGGETYQSTEASEGQRWNGLYYANRKTKTFHYSYCEAAAKISDENLYITEFRGELANEDYKPCGFCNP